VVETLATPAATAVAAVPTPPAEDLQAVTPVVAAAPAAATQVEEADRVAVVVVATAAAVEAPQEVALQPAVVAHTTKPASSEYNSMRHDRPTIEAHANPSLDFLSTARPSSTALPT
jgi:hypothetical protein